MGLTNRLARLLLAWQLVFGSALPVVTRGVDLEGATAASVETADAPQDSVAGDAADAPRGLRFRLSRAEGQAARAPEDGAKVVAAERLSDAEAEKILRRLPPLEAGAGDRQEFALRERSLPPPRTGRTINVSFPPPAEVAAPGATPAATNAPLEVLRYAPEGEIPVAAQLSVTFSQPMVAVTSQAELAAQESPVKLSPQPKGRWRWVGTRTLLFEPDVRFPAATRYTATVPAGVRAASGVVARGARVWTFSTPPPRVLTTHPAGDAQPRDPLMFVAFDQRIDPASVLRTIRLRAVGAAAQPALRLASEGEVKADERVRKLAAEAGEGRWVAFRAASQLPGDAEVTAQIGPGTPSAEGPLVTTMPQAFSFRTYGALRVTRRECGHDERCTPFDSFQIDFNNPLDEEAFDESQVTITPAIPGARIEVEHNTIVVAGLKRRLTSYRVTLSRSLRDVFGQTLGRDTTFNFVTKTAPAALAPASDDWFVVQDPAAPPAFSIYSVNYARLRARLYRVGPEHWEAFSRFMRGRWQGERTTAEPPGKLALATTVAVRSKPDEPVETRVDLSPALEGGRGQVVVVVEPEGGTPRERERERVVSWVQVTEIGLDAFVDQTELRGWATSLKDGRPLAGVALELWPTAARATTDAEGLARVVLPTDSVEAVRARRPAEGGTERANLLVARRGADVAILPEQFEWWGSGAGWRRRETPDALRWYVFDDRKLYRPGEEVHVKGWLRRIGSGARGDVGPERTAKTISYVLSDSRGNEIAKGALQLNALGGFDTSFKLPPTMNLGHATLMLGADAADVQSAAHQHNFQVQEFRRPEFEVGAQASEGPHKVGGHAETTVSASYFAGGGLQDAPVQWRVTSRPAQFVPPNRGDFTFGKWTPWWRSAGDGGDTRTETFDGRTDAEGKHRLRIDFESVNPPRASSVEAQASVTDVNRQQWTATTTLLVHAADIYVGVRSPRTFVRKGEPLIVEAIAVDLDGKVSEGRAIEMRAVRLEWRRVKGEWIEQEVDPETCTVRSAREAVRCTFTPKAGGRFSVTARVRDDRERVNESELTLWVEGGRMPAGREVGQEAVELIPDRKEYRAGEVAEILVQSPFAPAEGVLTLRRSGILRAERFRMDGPTHTLRVPVEEAHVPNFYVQVDLVGAAPRMDEAGEINERLPKRPAFASGELNLQVPPLERKLAVTARPREATLEPGGETMVEVEVKDAAGRAVAGGELAVVVADESVLALTGYRLDDPLSVFYTQREEGAADYHLREKVQLASAADLLAALGTREGVGVGVGTGGGGPGGSDGMVAMSGAVNAKLRGRTQMMEMSSPMLLPPPSPGNMAAEEAQPGIRVRANFDALAVFAAAVPTDAQGRARVPVKVPDNLTRYRVMAVAVAGGRQFGAGESSITARAPLMVRPSAPRFLNFGDRAELPVVVQNQTDRPLEVSVAVRASNADLTEGAGRRLTVAANDRAEVRFPVAADRAGTARFQIAAAAGRFSDAAEVSLPVWTPATTEAFATYGELDEGAILQPIKAPAGVLPQFGGLEITTSSTQLQELTDALLYLNSYPYECSEQLASRVLGVAALGDVLAAFRVKDAPSPEAMRAAVARDIKRLQGLQNHDGGFGFWRRGERSWPYVSLHVAHALARAREKGFDVPAHTLENSKRYLREIEQRIPPDYPVNARRAIVAYALNVRLRMKDRDVARASRLVSEAGLDKLSLEAVGWLLPVLAGDDAASRAETEAIRRHLANRATETAAAAHFVTSYGDEGDYLLLHSERRADAIILESLILTEPAHDLIPKLVRGLLAHRKRGRWSNTQENVFVLLALDRYFRTYERAEPNFTARAWLGEAFAGELKFAGRSTDRQQINVPMSYLLDAARAQPAQNLAIGKEGAGRLYYRVGISYAPASLRLDAADYGFTVERAYEAVDDPRDVRREADGTWRIKSGARVRVRLTMTAPSRRYHVALVDPLPAGLEALNPALAVTGDIPEDRREAGVGRWWRPVWFEHQNLRDERAEAFASLLWEGVHSYTYVARATTPGRFVVPPPKAEEMYHPETFGRGATDRVVVED